MNFGLLKKVFTPLYVLGCIAVFYIIFALIPSLDVKVSSYFYDQQNGFWLRSAPEFSLLRKMFIYTMTSWATVSVVITLILYLFPSRLPVWFQQRRKIFEVTLLVFLFGPLLLVNGLLKGFWGRARPENIKEFSGSLEFTPPFEMSDQCLRNCSFVSGEGAGATAFLIGAVLIYSVSNHAKGARYLLGLATVGAFFAMGLRIAMGGHFLSDTVFSFLFVVLIASLILGLEPYRQILDGPRTAGD